MSAQDFLKVLAQQLAQAGVEAWQGMNEEMPMEPSEQLYLIYQLSQYLQRMNAQTAQRIVETPF